MRHIQRKISLESMTSRLPSVVPSYFDGELYHFDLDSISGRTYLYPTNYGMVPCSLPMKDLLSDIRSFESIDNVLTKDCANAAVVIVSFQSISNIYYFFREYYDLIVKHATCKKFYHSAVEYYDQEVKMSGGTELRYGSDRAYYERIDSVFESLGGKVDDKEPKDVGFYHWLCEYIVPSFSIADEYTDYWNASKLYYGDAVKWRSWFTQMYSKYSGVTDCNKTEDCCECSEYLGRGGDDMYSELGKWIDAINANIVEMNEYIDASINCPRPNTFMLLQVPLLSNIDDMGYQTIFSTEYDVNTDYRTLDQYSGTYSLEKTGRTIADFEGEVLILSGNGEQTGVEFDETFLDKKIDRGLWVSYFDTFEKDHPSYFYTGTKYGYYGYDKDGNIRTGDTEEDVRVQISTESYGITSADVIVDGDTMMDISLDEYGYSRPNKDGNTKLYVIRRDSKTDVPYTYYDGKPRFAKATRVSGQTVYTFDFIIDPDTRKVKLFPWSSANVSENEKVEHFMYNGFDYVIKDKTGVTINDEVIDLKSSGSPLNRIDGYADTDEGRILIIDEEAYIEGGINVVRTDKAIILDDHVDVPVESEEVEVYSSNVITGVASSKLSTFASYRMMTDDVGNEIPAYRDASLGYFYQPNEGDSLEPMYQIGTVANVTEFSMTEKNIEDITSGVTENYYCGDILTSMEFYYKYIGGETDESTRVSASETGGSSLEAIRRSEALMESESGRFFEEDIYCDVVYYIGATLLRTKAGFSLAPGLNHGVMYKETVRFVREQVGYYTKRADENVGLKAFTDPYNHAISYPVYIYNMEQEQHRVETNYDSFYYTALAEFSMDIWVNNEDKWPEDMEKRNFMDVAPTIMEEVNIGFSAPQNITNDIYIDRGISALFEKQLKLGEVSTLDALESYGQGFFKINT